jgi:hypothetical protein
MKLNLPQFATQKELLKYLVKNKSELIQLKEASANKKADGVVYNGFSEGIIKSVNQPSLPKDNHDEGIIYRTVIPNTYYWLDSHDDVHEKGIFTKSIQENKAKVRHTHDHVQALTAKVGKVLDLYEKEVSWKDLGVNKAGNTICLMADTEIRKAYNEMIYNDYVNGEIDQHSVEMIYVKMSLAVNDADEKAEYKEWQRVFPLLGNPEKALEQGYFFIQKESKLKAFSCVVEGSNSLTGVYNDNNEAADKGTLLDIEPSKDTQRIDFAKLAKAKIFNN